MAYEDLSFEELEEEIRREEDEVKRLRAEQSRISSELYEDVRREEAEVRSLRDEYRRVSAEIREKVSSMEAVESILISRRGGLLDLVAERDRARSRLYYWRKQRRIARARRRRLERQRHKELLRVRPDRIRLERLRRSFEEAKDEERDAEARYRVELRAYRSARDEALALRKEIREDEKELKRIRRDIERLPSPTDLLERIRDIEREIERKPDRLEDRLREIDKQIDEIEAELEKKREALVIYTEWEFAKYYKYERGPVYRRRHFEIRGTFTLPKNVKPEDVEETIERYFDDVMLALGIDPDDFPVQGWVTGAESVGRSRTFNREVDAVVEDKRRGYIWRYPEYPTRIIVSEGEVSA